MASKIAIIGTVGLPASYGGFETLVEYLTQYLNSSHEISVYCSSNAYPLKKLSHNNSKLIYIPLNANGIQSIPYDIISIFHAHLYADTLLILGVSGCIFLPFIRIFSRKKIIINIDGLEWKRDKWSKYAKWFLKKSERIAVKYADYIISDNKVIQEYVKSEYGATSFLIPYGADHVQNLPASDTLIENYPFLEKKYAFSVCRIEPENNIHLILDALSQQDYLPVVLIGNWQSSNYGIELYNKFSKYKHIHLLNPIYDQNILNQIRSNCFVYLHGHSAGGTNPSLVEAMYLRLPIFAFSIDYNIETTENKAFYFANSNQLLELLKSVDSAKLSSCGLSMFEIAKRRYVWQLIANQYANIFDS